MVSVPRLVVAAPASGHGKTTVATGLMAALRAAGHEVSGHKVGPDYIDPGYHALATGRPGRNLDPHLVGEQLLVPLFLHGAATPRPADVAVVEGVMGLYDGALGRRGFASTAHVAADLGAPVVLVVDISHAARSVGAVVHGMATFDPAVRVAGVILNKAGSPRHAAEARGAVEELGFRVLGVLHRDDGISAPSRHLGLVPAAERPEAEATLARLAARVAEHVDVDAVLSIARTAPDLDGPAWDPEVALGESARPLVADSPVVAVAGGRAFTFRYAETEELLRAAGCRVEVFDPTTDAALPAGTAALYVGGGFPEVHAAELGSNAALLRAVRDAVRDGLPTVAECAGLLYLCRTVDGVPMSAALPAAGAMTPGLTLGYRTARAHDSLLTRRGERVTGHEFHRTTVLPGAGDQPAWTVAGEPAGFASDTLHASYLHVHWAGFPHLAARLADAARAYAGRSRTPGPDLHHHGDREAAAGLVDLAVNVHPGPRPAWLDTALRASFDDLARYPDAGPARAALAARHRRRVRGGAADRRWRRGVHAGGPDAVLDPPGGGAPAVHRARSRPRGRRPRRHARAAATRGRLPARRRAGARGRRPRRRGQPDQPDRGAAPAVRDRVAAAARTRRGGRRGVHGRGAGGAGVVVRATAARAAGAAQPDQDLVPARHPRRVRRRRRRPGRGGRRPAAAVVGLDAGRRGHGGLRHPRPRATRASGAPHSSPAGAPSSSRSSRTGA